MRGGLRRGYLCLMAVLAGVYWAVPAGRPRAVAELVFALTVVVAIVAGGWMDRSRRPGWWVFALGVLGLVCGDAVAFGYVVAHATLPFPSGADAGYLLGYVALSAGLALLQRGRPWDVTGLLDAAVMTAGGGLLLWIALGVPLGGGLSGTTVVELGYPVGDIALLAFAVWMITSSVFVLERGVVLALAVGAVAMLVVPRPDC